MHARTKCLLEGLEALQAGRRGHVGGGAQRYVEGTALHLPSHVEGEGKEAEGYDIPGVGRRSADVEALLPESTFPGSTILPPARVCSG